MRFLTTFMDEGAHQRSWIHYAINPTTEINAFRENLFAFLETSPQKVFPKGRAKTRFFDELGVDSEDASNLDLLLNDTIPTTMPFTGKFSFKLNREDFRLNIKNLSLDGVDRLYENDSQLSFQTAQNRNSLDSDCKTMEIGKFAVLISALRFAHLRGKTLLNGTFAQQELNKKFRKKKPFATTLDKSYVQLLMAVESLHTPTIFEKLGDNLENFSIGLTRVRDFFSACLKETREAQQIIEDLERLISALDDTTSICKDYAGKSESDWIDSAIFATFAHLFKSLNSDIGANLSKSPTEIVTKLSLMVHFNQNSTKSHSFIPFSRITNSIVNEYLSLERLSQVPEERESVKTTVEATQALAVLMHQDLESNLEQLLEIKDQYDHYSKSIIEDVPENFTTFYERLNRVVKWLSYDPKELNFESVLFSPDDYVRVYDSIFLGASPEYIFREQLRKWTDTMEKNPFKGDQSKKTSINFSVLNLVDKPAESNNNNDDRLNLTSVHALLQTLVDEVAQATSDYTKTLSALDRRKSTPGGANSQGEADTLRKHRYDMHKDYSKLINELGESPTWENFEIFVHAVGKIVNDFTKEVNEQYTGSNEASGPPKAMMIGLGQAGQQIVRAAIARMLNTTTDVRSQNMLKGLGIEWEKVRDFGQLDKVAKLETEREYFKAFDNANLLAINAGAELKRMLGAPYNYIWGSPDHSDLKKWSTKNCVRPATNLALLDEQGKGSGNKMGKGRAYAVLADAGLEQALNQKKGSQSITQICIVHSFAGGSGSGMVLPFLSIVKDIFPTALIWVFSAGVEYAGDDPYRAHNTTYITSDILQAHYDALHHRQKNISTRRWRVFQNQQIKQNLANLNDSWEKISQSFANIKPKEYYVNIDGFLNDDEATSWSEIGCKQPDNVEYSTKDHHELLLNCLPIDDTAVTMFTAHATDPLVSRKVELWWKKWHELAQDLGSRVFEQHLGIDKNPLSDDDSSMRTRYKITHGHIRSIAKGIELLRVKGAEEAMEFVNESMDIDPDTKRYMRLGIETTATPEKLEDLQRDVEQYGEKMRAYHDKIEEFGMKIKVMIGAREDTNIKHVIVSNSHLDRAASFYKGGESRFEIYNSVMIDVFMNLIHGLVEEVDYTDVESLEASASSFEFMDASDLRTVTAPPIHATLIDYSNTFETNNSHGYSQAEDRNNITGDPVYRVFKHLFSAGESPLYDKGMKGFQVEGDALATQSLFKNFFSNKGGIRNFSPSDVIDRFEPKSLIFSREDLGDFIGELKSDPELKKSWALARNPPHNFGENELLNMCNWLSLWPVTLLSQIYTKDDDLNSFLKNTSEMQGKYTSLMEEQDRTSIFNQLNRKNTLKNHISSLLPDASNTAAEQMQFLLEDMGILTPQHLAAMPSGLFYEYAPNILAQRNLDKNIKCGTWGNYPLRRLFETNVLESRPPPSRSLAKEGRNWKGEKSWVRGTSATLAGAGAFDSSELHYLRIPTIPRSPGEKSAKVPYLEVNSKFMKDFTSLKIGTGEIHPQYNNIAFVDKIIKVASNNSQEVSRHASETPILRQATDDLRVYSYPRSLYPDEPGIAAYIRYLLFGDIQNTNNSIIVGRIQDLIYATVPDESPLSPDIGPHDFNRKTFKMKVFETKLFERIQEISNLPIDGMLPGVKEIFEIIQENMHQIMEVKEPNLIEFFTKLSTRFSHKNSVFSEIMGAGTSQDVPQVDLNLDAHDDSESAELNNPTAVHAEREEMDETVVLSGIIAVQKLFSRIADLLFLTKRQHEFLKGIAKPGQGVAFNFEGTVDSVRSAPNRYLALVNNSSDISPQLVKSAVSHYYSAYMDRGKSNQPPTGKAYIQRLKSGPVANITLLQQKAGISEISEGFQELMSILETEQFDAVTSPLVHPYSFLRNILWLSTMKDRWLSDPSDYYRDRLEIPADLIDPIFGQPEIIKALITDVKTNNDMQGYALSDQDIKLWESTKYCSEALDDSNRSQKLKMPLHVPDFLLIKAWQCMIEEPKALLDIKNHEKLLEVYPEENWYGKFEHKGLLTQSYKPIKREFFTTSGGSGSSNGPFDTTLNPFEKTQPQMESTEDIDNNDNPWLDALKKWMEWLKQDELNDEGQ